MARTGSSYNCLYLKHRLTHQHIRRTQMCAVKDQIVLIPLAGKLDKGRDSQTFPRDVPANKHFHLALLEEKPFTIKVPGTSCVESQPHSSSHSSSFRSHLRPEAFCQWGLHQWPVNWERGSSGSPSGQTIVHPHLGRTVFTAFTDRWVETVLCYLTCRKSGSNITGNLVLLLMLIHFTKIEVGIHSSLLFQWLLPYLPPAMLTRPKLRRFVFL